MKHLTRNKLLDYTSWTLLVISIILLMLTGSYLENIINGKRFVFEKTITGLIFAIVWTYINFKTNRQYFNGGEKRASAILGFFFSIVALTIILSALYNYETGRNSRTYKKAFVIRKSTNRKSGTNYMHLVIDNTKERFNPNDEEFRLIRENDSILLTIGKGKLDYGFVIRFDTIKKVF